MTEIVGNFTKVEWWVNTIIIALIVSVAAGFVRDLIPKWLSSVSGIFKRRSIRNAKIIIKQSRLIASNSNLFLEYILNRYMGFILSLFLLIFAMALPPLHSFYEMNPQYDPFGNVLEIPKLSKAAVGVIAILYLFFSLNFLFGLGRQRKILRRTKKLSIRSARMTPFK